jgi:chloramphenicol O-acetyltransferase type A
MNNHKQIDIGNFVGKKHFLWFKKYREPTYGMTSELDITTFYHHVKTQGHPMFLSLVYLVTMALNEVTEFRYRYDGTDIILFDRIDPAFTLMTDLGHYDNCDDVHLGVDFRAFLADAGPKVARVKSGASLANPQIDVRYDQFYISSCPWIEFLGVTHPMDDNLFAYIPRITWDKFHIENDKVTMHLNMVVHHALISGKPLADGFLKIQEFLNDPSRIIK